jgi:hypothetical protein
MKAMAEAGTGALYQRFVGPLLSRDDGADAEQLSQLTLTALGQASLRRHWPLVSGSLAGLGAQLQRRDLRLLRHEDGHHHGGAVRQRARRALEQLGVPFAVSAQGFQELAVFFDVAPDLDAQVLRCWFFTTGFKPLGSTLEI